MLPVRSPDVIYKELSDGAVLFHTREEVYFGLNDVGSRIWKLLPPDCDTVEEVCAELQRQFPQEGEDTLRADVTELLENLASFGLVVPRSDDSRSTEDEPTAAA